MKPQDVVTDAHRLGIELLHLKGGIQVVYAVGTQQVDAVGGEQDVSVQTVVDERIGKLQLVVIVRKLHHDDASPVFRLVIDYLHEL